MGNTGLREDLISSAVSFLRDPTVADSPLTKRISFLESKGLTQSETDEALRRASTIPTIPQPIMSRGGRYGNPTEIERDWRDWFVMTVIGGGVGYLFTKLAKKYLVPALQPPSQTELEEAQARLEERYDEVSELLQAIRSDTETVKGEVKEQSQKLNDTVKSVELAVEECLSGEAKRDKEMLIVQEEMEALRDAIPQMLEKNKEAQTAAILDLQTELKSLKSLLAVRTTPATTQVSAQPQSSTIFPSQGPLTGTIPSTFGLQPSASALSRFTNNRPIGIPAWQLANAPVNGDSRISNVNGESHSSSSSLPLTSTGSSSSAKVQGISKLNSILPKAAEDSLNSEPEGVSDNAEQTADYDDDHVINSSYHMLEDVKDDKANPQSASPSNSVAK
ncbi:peroxisomal membrane anchor protein conserved region-domain-containing protein [Phakopsora pachyrhizi]|uniref:Peroxisomal membrane protein PEX14 n=1 Tax=Phakopsora pachyrhizi TaxID=170000 RepID=A0AAV0BW67_PHAPC|nr:peroxisomal membrane anchor protein conserved region-domain-containing protein [Phakopsora pachyrhizi]